MAEVLQPPQTGADAIVIVRSLSDISLQPVIKDEFGEERYDCAYDNALAWQARLDQAEHPYNEDTLELARFGELYAPGMVRTVLQADQPTAPGAMTDILTEPSLFPEIDPHPFDSAESEVVLTALRLTAETARPGEQLLAADFLARNSPRRRERATSLLAVAGVTGLLAHSLRLLK